MGGDFVHTILQSAKRNHSIIYKALHDPRRSVAEQQKIRQAHTYIYTYKHTTHLKSDILNTEDILIFTCNSFGCRFRLA